ADRVWGTVLGDSGGLTLQGSHTLTLAAAQTYSGITSVEGGTLKAGVADAIAASQLLRIGDGARFELGGFDQHVARLQGGGTLALGANTLTLNGAGGSAVFTGTVEGSGELVKDGAYTQVLGGALTYTGITRINAGTLTLDGGAGGGRLNGDVIGRPGSRLVLQNGATLTGAIDPLDVSVLAGSTWTVTGDSTIDTLELAGNVTYQVPRTVSIKTLRVTNLVGENGVLTVNA
ncbi:autotransporter-associated beta strand repeat-containing protein, partial [Paludibacterium paludis]